MKTLKGIFWCAVLAVPWVLLALGIWACVAYSGWLADTWAYRFLAWLPHWLKVCYSAIAVVVFISLSRIWTDEIWYGDETTSGASSWPMAVLEYVFLGSIWFALALSVFWPGLAAYIIYTTIDAFRQPRLSGD